MGQSILSVEECVEAWVSGARVMFFAMIILVLAWALGSITEGLHTPDFLISVLGSSIVPGLIPALVFVLAAATAFATGTSWGTMGILLPLVVPFTWSVLTSAPNVGIDAGNAAADPRIFYSAVACVITGAVWGDHCSPISDTTILSSMASGCDHMSHVATQLPYALFVGGVALLLGSLASGLGVPLLLCYLLGAAMMVGVTLLIGKTA